MYKVIPLLAAALLFTGCASQGPSEGDVRQALVGNLGEISGYTGGLVSSSDIDVSLPDDCTREGSDSRYRCEVWLSVSRGVASLMPAQPLSLNFIQDRDGRWRLAQ
ncbi:hypothetical protein [Halotalea alkalilenta]|uniref:Lipoprotein n=1 Tax=Halotalea alkalilenta TaxID=376489 RepID=A0A172YBB0_9GAMM|nr:hypothetical protein [Halotalea alkalilenta]ANF56533.1 hypothetical protein A5892_02820 [Halotalea alkalilenta]